MEDFTRPLRERKEEQNASISCSRQGPFGTEKAPAKPSIQLSFELTPTATLTACLDTAECPATARRIFRVLHDLALLSVHTRGLAARPTVGVFHLPVELVAAHLEMDRTTVWRNLKPLLSSGLLDVRDHFDCLKGQTAVTGKVWAVSLFPERVLSGQANPVRLTRDDLAHDWRDLTRDVREGRTAYALTRTVAQQEADREKRDAQDPQAVEAARRRASERAADRRAARARGEKVPTGRPAATLNAAATRADRGLVRRPADRVQQSKRGLKTVGRAELIKWVLAPFSRSSDVTWTVAESFSEGLEAIFTLPALAMHSKHERNAAVEKAAKALAASFEDTRNLKFWCWLLWQLIRGADQGQSHMDDVSHLLARVLHDIKHDETCGNRKQKKPAALVVQQLRDSGLLDALREFKRHRVGFSPGTG